MTSKYLDIFAREAEEHLQILRQGILELEQEGTGPEKVHEILRSAHTLKGSARMLDLADLAQVSHQLEELLRDLEEGRRELTSSLVDLLLVATDALEALIAQAHSGGEIKVDVEAVIQGLETGVLPEIETGAEETSSVAPPAGPQAAAETVRASVERLDRMVNLIGEMLIIRGQFENRGRQLEQIRRRLELFLRRLRKAENYHIAKELLDDLTRFTLDSEQDTLTLGYLTEEVHAGAMELRMLPLSTITDDMQRTVRGLAREQQKEIQLVIRGDEVELDRMMLEALKPMLMHMLCNAVDHGLESPEERRQAGKSTAGRIELCARYEGGFVRLDLRDDGRGIDPHQVRRAAVEKRLVSSAEASGLSDEEAIYLILRPGFTTRKIITDVSGRGVGMDVVKTNIDRVKGNLVIHSAPGRGTEMVLQLPLTLAVVTGLIIECEAETYAVPLHYVSEILRLREGDILTEGGREVVRVHGTTLPLFSLAGTLGLPKRQTMQGERVTALVLTFRERQIACLVSRAIGTQELVAKTMGRQLKSVEFFSGATILGDGSPALILSVPDLFAGSRAGRGTQLRQDFENTRTQAQKGRVLVVDDSITTRTMEKNILETHGYAVTVAISGEEALDQVAEADFDLVVSDVEMPGIDGFELTHRLRQMERHAEVPVVICTSLASDEHRRKGIEVGAQAYIVKGSFDQSTLLETVELLIG